MYQNINFHEFSRGFDIRPDTFTYAGQRALFDWLEELAEDTGSPIEFDPIALCCEYTEYENLAEFQDNYDGKWYTIGAIEEYTTVIRLNDESFIVADF